jgi:hypothetical protein
MRSGKSTARHRLRVQRGIGLEDRRALIRLNEQDASEDDGVVERKEFRTPQRDLVGAVAGRRREDRICRRSVEHPPEKAAFRPERDIGEARKRRVELRCELQDESRRPLGRDHVTHRREAVLLDRMQDVPAELGVLGPVAQYGRMTGNVPTISVTCSYF